MMRRIYTLLLSCSLALSSMAQEYTSPLKYDMAKKQETQLRTERMSSQIQQRNNTAVTLPFIDDFSQDHFPGNADGNIVLWEDLGATISGSFGISPPSINVAVFDGLNAYGSPYDPISSNSNGHADTLTSMPMDLAGKQNVVLSFFYQPEGYGEAPEGNDSLVLQFYDPGLDQWTNQWHALGSTAFPYVPVRLEIQDQHLQDGFRFRFRNYGRLTGALDTWSIDWVYLDENRSVDDASLVDVGFALPVYSFLSSDYVAIPWDHYTPTASENVIVQRDVIVRNNREQGALVSTSGYTVEYDGAPIADFTDSQSPTISAQSNEAITQEVNSSPNSFIYPTNVSDTTAEFYVEFEFATSPDLHEENNRMSFTQVFSNYYAYDDGKADNAYGIQNFSGSGKVAFRYDFIEADTLMAVDMHFVYQGGAALEDQIFYLTIWEDNGGAPSEIIYQDLTSRQVIFEENNGFARYLLQDTVLTEANTSYFIGWVQPDDISLNIGNDLSAQLNQGRLYYDLGTSWTPSSYEGTIMMRPVFPPIPIELPVGLEEDQLERLEVWPNPAQDIIHILGDYPMGSQARLLDLEGRMVASKALYLEQESIDVSFTAEGLYLLDISTPHGARSIKKVVISR